MSQKLELLQKENKEIHGLKTRIENLEKINQEKTAAFSELSIERSELKKTNVGLKAEIIKYQNMMRNMNSSRLLVSPNANDNGDSFEFAGIGWEQKDDRWDLLDDENLSSERERDGGANTVPRMTNHSSNNESSNNKCEIKTISYIQKNQTPVKNSRMSNIDRNSPQRLDESFNNDVSDKDEKGHGRRKITHSVDNRKSRKQKDLNEFASNRYGTESYVSPYAQYYIQQDQKKVSSIIQSYTQKTTQKTLEFLSNKQGEDEGYYFEGSIQGDTVEGGYRKALREDIGEVQVEINEDKARRRNVIAANAIRRSEGVKDIKGIRVGKGKDVKSRFLKETAWYSNRLQKSKEQVR